MSPTTRLLGTNFVVLDIVVHKPSGLV